MANQNLLLQGLLPPTLPAQLQAVVALVNDMDATLHAMDAKLGQQNEPTTDYKPLDFEVPQPGGFSTNQELYITSVLLSTPAAGVVTVNIANASWFSVNMAVNTFIHLRFTGSEAKEIARGSTLTVTGVDGARCHMWAFVS